MKARQFKRAAIVQCKEVEIKKEENPLKDKGKRNGLCNRFACLSPNNVLWYNHATDKYYCENCARMLNEANEKEAMEIFGHALCTLR